MEQLIKDIEALADAQGVKPATVLQRFGYSGTAWKKWKRGEVTCTMSMADKIRKHIGDNFPNHKGESVNDKLTFQGAGTENLTQGDAA